MTGLDLGDVATPVVILPTVGADSSSRINFPDISPEVLRFNQSSTRNFRLQRLLVSCTLSM